MKRRLAVPCCSVAPAPAAFGCRPASPAYGSSLSLCRGSAVRGGRGDSPPCASPRRWLPGGSLLLCCTCAPTRKARERKNTALRPLLLVPSARLATSVERKGEARQGAGGRNGMRNGRERKRRQGRERPGRDGGRPLVGRASEFRPPSLWDSFASSLWGKNGCARYSNRREREGRTALGTPSASWCYSCSVRISSRVIELASEK